MTPRNHVAALAIAAGSKVQAFPWGTGDVRIKDVLQLLKREKYPIVADIEYDYGGAADPWNEVKKCFDYCKSALE
jgi:hypothetical protein